MNRKDRTIYITDNYKMFKHLTGNREVTEKRKAAIIASINKIWYICSPIIVNEKMEVIDGQGRLEAAKYLGLPVYYTVVEGIGREECIQMNIKQTNWTLGDFVHAYAESGEVSYRYLRALLDEFKGKIDFRNVAGACLTGAMMANEATIKEGTFFCNAEDYERARKELAWCCGFNDGLIGFATGRRPFFTALRFVFRCEDIDKDIFKQAITKKWSMLSPAVSVLDAVGELENAYNYRTRDKIYLKDRYRAELDYQRKETMRRCHERK